MRLLLLTFVCTLGLASAAFGGQESAGCNFVPLNTMELARVFELSQMDKLKGEKTTVDMDARTFGAPCTFPFAGSVDARSPNLLISSLDLVSRPRHGTIAAAAPHVFIYTPNEAFKGIDQFRVNACGAVANNSGCSLFTFIIEVRCSGRECGRKPKKYDYILPRS
jgi:hypothetical protein